MEAGRGAAVTDLASEQARGVWEQWRAARGGAAGEAGKVDDGALLAEASRRIEARRAALGISPRRG